MGCCNDRRHHDAIAVTVTGTGAGTVTGPDEARDAAALSVEAQHATYEALAALEAATRDAFDAYCAQLRAKRPGEIPIPTRDEGDVSFTMTTVNDTVVVLASRTVTMHWL